MATGRATPLTAKGSRTKALQPVDPETGNPLELYGPWTFVHNVWKAIEAGPPPRPDPSLSLSEAENMRNGGSDTPLVEHNMMDIEEDHGGPGQNANQEQGRRGNKMRKTLLEINRMVEPLPSKAQPVFERLRRQKNTRSPLRTMVGAYPPSTNDGYSSTAETFSDLCSGSSGSTSTRGTPWDQRKLAFALRANDVFVTAQNSQFGTESQRSFYSFSPESLPEPSVNMRPPLATSHLDLEAAPAPGSKFNLENLEHVLANAVSNHEVLVSQQINMLGELN